MRWPRRSDAVPICQQHSEAHRSEAQQQRSSSNAAVSVLTIFSFVIMRAGIMKAASNSYIRELAVQPRQPNNVVFGGFDQTLSFADLSTPEHPYTQRLNMEGA